MACRTFQLNRLIAGLGCVPLITPFAKSREVVTAASIRQAYGVKVEYDQIQVVHNFCHYFNSNASPSPLEYTRKKERFVF
jgi:hypothetical protein